MTDPTPPQQPETGWPTAPPTSAPPAPVGPSWAELPVAHDSDEDEYDAWLDAQDLDPARRETVDVAEPLADEAGPKDLGSAAPEPVEVLEPLPASVEQEPVLAAEAEEDHQPAVPGTRSGAALVTVLVLVALVLAGLTAWLAVLSSRTSGGGATERARSAALVASRDAARLIFSYDYRHLDKDFAAGKAVTTGKFASDYTRTTAKLITDVAPKYQAVVVADVSDAGVVSANADRVQVLMFVNQRSTSSLASGQKITQSRVTMVLEHVHGHWLVSDISAL